jgi:hypothetical protein
MERHPQQTIRIGDTLSAGRVINIQNDGESLHRVNRNGNLLKNKQPFLIGFKEAEIYVK